MMIMKAQDNMTHPFLEFERSAFLKSNGKHVDTLEVLSADMRIAFEGYFSL
jgi:hypothetical protein